MRRASISAATVDLPEPSVPTSTTRQPLVRRPSTPALAPAGRTVWRLPPRRGEAAGAQGLAARAVRAFRARVAAGRHRRARRRCRVRRRRPAGRAGSRGRRRAEPCCRTAHSARACVEARAVDDAAAQQRADEAVGRTGDAGEQRATVVAATPGSGRTARGRGGPGPTMRSPRVRSTTARPWWVSIAYDVCRRRPGRSACWIRAASKRDSVASRTVKPASSHQMSRSAGPVADAPRVLGAGGALPGRSDARGLRRSRRARRRGRRRTSRRVGRMGRAGSEAGWRSEQAWQQQCVMQSRLVRLPCGSLSLRSHAVPDPYGPRSR